MRKFAIALVAALALCGCTGDESPPTASPSDSFSQQVAQARTEAEEAGSAADQLAVLDNAAKTGEVTMEELLTLRAAYAECLTAGGFELIDHGTTTDRGYPYPDYAIKVAEGAGSDTTYMDQCAVQHFQWADMLYQSQPMAVEGQDRQFDERRPQFEACLRDKGVDVPQDLTRDEFVDFLRAQAKDDFAQHSADPGGGPLIECMGEVGIGSF
jgi:hypothetical protein